MPATPRCSLGWGRTLRLLVLPAAFATAVVRGPGAETPPPVFTVQEPDHALSPHTGMTRRHWFQAAHYLLEGAFSYIHSLDDPLKFPKQPGKSYPHRPEQVPTEKLEGLSRTLFAAAPLLKADPDLTFNGIKVAEYYRHQFAQLVDPRSPSYIKPRDPKRGPHQNLVEFGAMAMAFSAAPEVLWNPLPQAQRDALAAVMLSYGDGPTVPSNWRFFNIFVLSFLQSQGYAINEPLLLEYLEKALADYRGHGWYHDNPAFDYYSMWGFQLYGMLWAHWFGHERYPGHAARFVANFWEMKDSYPLVFGRDGKMTLWGRSNAYRFASVSPFPLVGLERRDDVNYGWIRRISSGVLLQFLTHPEFMDQRVPTLGFYGPFEPAVQIYNCRGSVYWMGKAFLGLCLPADTPFWTATENEGPWASEFAPDTVVNTFQPGSNILITNYPNSGAAEIRAWCHETVAKDWQKFRSSENYNRLAYNSAFPWQADGPRGEVAMNYVVLNRAQQWEALRLYTFEGFQDGTYRRRAVLETDPEARFRLADHPLPDGILRVDRFEGGQAHDVRLGHYALPHLRGAASVSRREHAGQRAIIIDNGIHQLALVAVAGWDSLEVVVAEGLHPEARESSVANAVVRVPARTPHRLVTLMLWRKSGTAWPDESLFPIRAITEETDGRCTLTWSDATTTSLDLR